MVYGAHRMATTRDNNGHRCAWSRIESLRHRDRTKLIVADMVFFFNFLLISFFIRHGIATMYFRCTLHRATGGVEGVCLTVICFAFASQLNSHDLRCADIVQCGAQSTPGGGWSDRRGDARCVRRRTQK